MTDTAGKRSDLSEFGSADQMEESHGFWWIAARPEQRVRGILRVDEAGELRLDTFGLLGDKHVGATDSDSQLLRILGETETGSYVSLEGCIRRSVRFLLEQPRETWMAAEAVFGLHFEPDEPWAFFGASFEMPLVSGWMSPASTETTVEFDSLDRPHRLVIAASIDAHPLWSSPSCTVELVKAVEAKQTAEDITRFTARSDVRALSTESLPAEEFSRIAVRPLQVLIGLSTGRYTAPLRGSVFNEPLKEGARLRPFTRRWHALSVSSAGGDPRYGFHYADFAALTSEARMRWLGRWAALRPVHDLYLATLQGNTFLEQRFLFLAQALETYHRLTYSRELLPSDAWADLRERMMGAIDLVPSGVPRRHDALQALNTKLTYFNEIGLRARVKELLSVLGKLGDQIAGDAGLAAFAGSVTDTRNYFTHWSMDLESKALRSADLAYATSRLHAALEVLLLREVGFANDSPALNEVMGRRVAWLPR